MRAAVLFGVLGGLVPAIAGVSFAAAPASPKPNEDGAATPPQVGESAAEVRAIQAELTRGVEGLHFDEGPEPYFAEARFVRAESLTLDGSYGGIITDMYETQAVGSVSVRVGSPEQGSANFFGPTSDVGFVLPLAPDPESTRKKLWLAMDGAFRGATGAYNAKQAVLSRLAGEAPPSEHARGPKPFVKLDWSADASADALLPRTEFDRKRWREFVSRLSSRFAQHAGIDNGDVMFLFLKSRELLVTSEGVVHGETRVRAVLAAVADTQAEDGMRLDHGLAIHLPDVPELTSEFEARGEALVDQVVGELEELAAAPMLDEDYDGPVVFAPQAAAQLLASTIAVHAGGQPPPLSEYGRVTELEPHWQDRLGKSVMPDWLSVTDDPAAPGFGHYELDGEGVPAQPVTLVKNGVLSDLLMTRTPNHDISESNGHARSTPALTVGPAISNLTVNSKARGLDQKALDRELLRRAQEDGYDFAYVVESLRDGNVLGALMRETAILYGGGRKVSLSIPARVFRVEPGGKRTLVRGVLLSPVSMRVLRRIRAVGRAPTAVPMRIAPGITGGFAADVGVDAVLAQTVDVEINTPALLIDGFELLVERGEHERLPTLVHPLRKGDAPSKKASE